MAGRRSRQAAIAASTEVDELNRLILSLANTVRTRVREGLWARGHDLTPSHTHLIPNLPREGMRLSTLAQRLRLTLARTGQLVQELEGVGYVERVPDESDGRAKRVVYTRRGLGLIDDSDRIQHEVAEEYAEILGADPITRLRDLLERLDAGLQKREDASEG
jgi:DNA-binding MarR family transcriptional regulator